MCAYCMWNMILSAWQYTIAFPLLFWYATCSSSYHLYFSLEFLGSTCLCPFVVSISNFIFSLLTCVKLDYLCNKSSLVWKVLLISFLHRNRKPRYKVSDHLPGLLVEKFICIMLECIQEQPGYSVEAQGFLKSFLWCGFQLSSFDAKLKWKRTGSLVQSWQI